MSDTWLSIEQAATALRLSVRTVNRHINAQKIQSRLHEGRREVLVRLQSDNPQDDVTKTDMESKEKTLADALLQPKSVSEVSSPSGEPPASFHSRLPEFEQERPATPSEKPRQFSGEKDAPSFAPPGEDPGFASDSGGRQASSEYQQVHRLTPGESSDSQDISNQNAGDTGGASNGSQGADERKTGVAASVDVETMLTLADQAADKADVAIVAYQTLARVADTQVRGLRRNARIAWVLVGVIVLVVMGGGWWVTQRMTAIQIELHGIQRMSEYNEKMAAASAVEVERLKEERDTAGQSASRAREEAALAKEQQARLEGKLAAMAEANKRPTTRPSLFERLFFGKQN